MIDETGFKSKSITSKLYNVMRNNAKKFAEYIKQQVDRNGMVKGLINAFKFFYNKVKTRGEWDLKNRPEWKLNKGDCFIFNGKTLRSDDPGNIHFGYVGAVMFPEKILRVGAGVYQIYSGTSRFNYFWTFFDDPRDSSMISYGYDLYMRDTLGSYYYVYKVIKIVKSILFWL